MKAEQILAWFNEQQDENQPKYELLFVSTYGINLQIDMQDDFFFTMPLLEILGDKRYTFNVVGISKIKSTNKLRLTVTVIEKKNITDSGELVNFK